MVEAGYSKVTASKPKNLTERRGFQQLLAEMGLTDELLTSALVKDIKKKPGRRYKELELGFRVRGRLKTAELETGIRPTPILNVLIKEMNIGLKSPESEPMKPNVAQEAMRDPKEVSKSEVTDPKASNSEVQDPPPPVVGQGEVEK